MGLDVTAYRKAVKIADWPEDAESADDIADLDYDFERCGYVYDGKVVDAVYPGEGYPLHRGDLGAGLYTYEESDGMRAGSYSGYNDWRDAFSWAALGMSARDVWETWEISPKLQARGASWLVNFSDCEGYICAEVAGRIAADIRAYEAIIRRGLASHGEYYNQKLDDWLRILDIAADGGYLEFH